MHYLQNYRSHTWNLVEQLIPRDNTTIVLLTVHYSLQCNLQKSHARKGLEGKDFNLPDIDWTPSPISYDFCNSSYTAIHTNIVLSKKIIINACFCSLINIQHQSLGISFTWMPSFAFKITSNSFRGTCPLTASSNSNLYKTIAGIQLKIVILQRYVGHIHNICRFQWKEQSIVHGANSCEYTLNVY